MEETHDRLFAHVADSLATEEHDRLTDWRNASGFNVPPEFCVLERTDTEWKAIEDALQREKRALRNGGAIDPADEALLHAIRNDVRVLDAKSRLSQNLRGVITAYKQFSDGI